MKDLKQFMKKNAYKLVYASIASSWIFGPIIQDSPCAFLFGEIPFPVQAYKSLKNKMK